MAITAQDIVGRIQKQLGSGWKESEVDIFMTGKPDTEVTGVVTTFAPSLEVLHKAVAGKKNLIISRESPYWTRSNAPGGGNGSSGLPSSWPGNTGGGPRREQNMEGDATFRAKRDYIAANNLVIYRLFANWNAQTEDMQLKGLAKALGWDKHYKPSGGQPWAKNNGFFELPPATLKETALHIKKTLGMQSIRIGGKADTMVHKAALGHGMYWIRDMQAT